MYRPFHKTLQKHSIQMHWISLRFYEMDDTWNTFLDSLICICCIIFFNANRWAFRKSKKRWYKTLFYHRSGAKNVLPKEPGNIRVNRWFYFFINIPKTLNWQFFAIRFRVQFYPKKKFLALYSNMAAPNMNGRLHLTDVHQILQLLLKCTTYLCNNVKPEVKRCPEIIPQG